MARAQSLNWEFDIGGYILHPLTVDEFGEGEEGRIEVADGSRKYEIRDQIFKQEGVGLSILIKDDNADYNVMQAAVKSGTPQDIYATGRNSKGEAKLVYAFRETDFIYGKKSGFDRKSKSEEIKNYFLLPRDIVEI